MFKLVKKVSQAFGVSGSEDNVRDIIKDLITPYVDDIQEDNMGNLIAIKKGQGQSKVMLTAHMDEIGLMVSNIDANGFLRVSNMGGIYAKYSIAQRVKFENGVQGVVFANDSGDLNINSLYIDIGAKNKKDAEKKIKIGDVATFIGETRLQGDLLTSKALDNRIGCAILIKLAEELKESKHNVYFVFTVQEEVGLRGAAPAAFQIRPDIAINIDVTSAGDKPSSTTVNDIKLGKGTAIKIKDRAVICHPKVKKMLLDTATLHNIPYQLEILEHGGTDTGVVLTTAEGIPSAALSIPTRYIHSTIETVSMSDVNNTLKLLIKLLEK